MKVKCSKKTPGFIFYLIFLRRTAMGSGKGNRFAACSACFSLAYHLFFTFPSEPFPRINKSHRQTMRSIQHTWAVSLLASGSAMTMRCKAWNCTLMWGPPNKKTEITTHLEHGWYILTAFLANIWWQRRAPDSSRW